MDTSVEFPIQTLPYKSKGRKWREQCVRWAANHTYFNFAPVRRDAVKMKINYDLVNGIIHMSDVSAIINPGNISTAFLPDKIQHYPIINSKLNMLRGEEGARIFDWRVTVINPNAVSQIEEEKRKQFDESVQQIVENPGYDAQQSEVALRENQEFYDFSWQDRKEIQANELLKQYSREYDFKQIFNDGFMDAAINGVEAYCCDIIGGEPVLYRLNPIKLSVFRNGSSNFIEDADVIVYEDYWSPGKVVEAYYDDLSVNDIKRISNEVHEGISTNPVGAAGNYNEAAGFIPRVLGEEGIMIDRDSPLYGAFDELAGYDGGLGSNLLPYDINGNIRVVRVWWKSKRKVLAVKSFDKETGNEVLDFYPETYVADKDAGETVQTLWINEMWEGTLIGEDIFARMRPCLVQYNSISNPSRCHAGIVGTLYNINEANPFSLVDMMKPYNYLYDAVHAKLVDLIATNWGKLIELDLALVPKGWEVEKWMYFARTNKVLVRDSFNENNKGASTKVAGMMNNASKGYVDADWGQSIQNYMNLLQWIKDSMSDLVGINRQREGSTYSRETVGGIERAVLQSSYITDWLFQKHENTKKRVILAFLEQAKAAIRGRSKKFQYILSDGSRKIMEIDGDEFCSCDYGLDVDNSQDTQKLSQNLDTLAQAGLQNQMLDFSSMLRLYTSVSMQEKIKIIESSQRRMEQRQQEAQQQTQQAQQQELQAKAQLEQQKMQQADLINQRDNQTKIDVANINARAEYLRLGIYEEQNNVELRKEEMEIDREKLRQEIEALDKEIRFKEKELAQKKEIEMAKIKVQSKKSSDKK